MSWQQPEGQPQQPEWGSAQPQPQPAQFGQPQPAQFGQPQPAQFGQPQPQQQPFGQPQPQPQFGAPQPGQQTPPPFYTPHPYEKKRSGFGKRQIIILVVLVLAVGGYYGYKHFTGQVSAGSLTVGECFNGGAEGQDISTVNSVPCTKPHSAQVVGEFTMTDTSYPDDDTLANEADAACKPFFQKIDATTLPQDADSTYLAPEEDGFNTGDKTVDCLVQSGSQDLTTSLVP
jgi:hypothetical protein